MAFLTRDALVIANRITSPTQVVEIDLSLWQILERLHRVDAPESLPGVGAIVECAIPHLDNLQREKVDAHAAALDDAANTLKASTKVR
ncbi:MAG TPA: hypothetical protein VGA56_20820 [Opitutaceae bacterium]